MRAPRLLALIALAVIAAAEGLHPPPPAAPKDFAVMAWGDSPGDVEQLRGMKEAGLNISGFCHAEELDRVRDAGLTCFVQDARANGYDWTSLPSDDVLRRNIAALREQIGGNSAALGFFLRDEPHASLMPGMGKVAAMLREAMPGRWPYVNLFPYRAGRDAMGASSYDDYVRMLVRTIGQPFLSYDNYSLVNGEMLDYFYINLEIVRRLGLETKTPFWNCILANAHFNYMEPSDATFHLQVYSTLAYGGRGIQYFTYFTPMVGNYRLGAIDQFGARTRTWEMLRRINNEIHALAPTLIKLRSTGVYHYPDVPEQGQGLATSRLIKSVEMTQRYVQPPARARFLIGEFEDEQGRPYFMIVNKDLAQSFRCRIDLKREGRLLRTSPYSGREEPFGREMDWLAPGAGILFRVE
jgi:hypothetical protein